MARINIASIDGELIHTIDTDGYDLTKPVAAATLMTEILEAVESDPWTKMLIQARKLDEKELRRHASVSITNRHRCTECFTCACAYVLAQREE